MPPDGDWASQAPQGECPRTMVRGVAQAAPQLCVDQRVIQQVEVVQAAQRQSVLSVEGDATRPASAGSAVRPNEVIAGDHAEQRRGYRGRDEVVKWHEARTAPHGNDRAGTHPDRRRASPHRGKRRSADP